MRREHTGSQLLAWMLSGPQSVLQTLISALHQVAMKHSTSAIFSELSQEELSYPSCRHRRR